MFEHGICREIRILSHTAKRQILYKVVQSHRLLALGMQQLRDRHGFGAQLGRHYIELPRAAQPAQSGLSCHGLCLSLCVSC